ncbi:hypothetical protein BRC81_16840 [Halobacteriales archaeon QS_1_68_20]|nr:MAG: hypothetical protein BRC81_16840 [Halobacteriales archaeon QS_1_68_20]
MPVFQHRMRNTLDARGITEPDPQPDSWYRMEHFLAVLDDVQKNVGESAVSQIGELTAENVEWPTDPESPAEAFEVLTAVYEAQHRNAPGGYEYERGNPMTVLVTSTTPYPCKFDEGYSRVARRCTGPSTQTSPKKDRSVATTVPSRASTR